MKLGKSPALRIVKRQIYDPASAKRMTEDGCQGDPLLDVKKTVLSWIHEFENKRIVESQLEFSILSGAKAVAGGTTTSLKLSRQLVVKKQGPNKLQGTQVRGRELNSKQIHGQSYLTLEDIL